MAFVRFATFPFLILLAACGLGDRNTGVVSETTNGLAGSVIDGEGGAAASARVAYRPADFLPGEGPKMRADTGTVLTDSAGRYVIKSLSPGEYFLDIRSEDGKAAAERHTLVPGAGEDTLPTRKLEAPGNLVLRFAAGASGPVRIRIFGTDVDLIADARDTAVLRGLAAADYRLRVTQKEKALAVDIPSVPVASDAQTAVRDIDPVKGTFGVTPPSAFALDSALVHAFLSGSGALKSASFDSVVRRNGDAISAVILSGIPLDSIPASVGSLVFLDSLWLNACGIKNLPAAFYGLDSLESLNLSYNTGLVPSKDLFSMTSLVHLDLSGLSLASVDADIANLVRLRDLRLNGNPLLRVPAEIIGLPALENLSLSDCQLDSVPRELIALTGLRQLFLSGNALTALPDAFSAAHALEKLVLDRNQLSALPASLTGLGRLQRIHLGQNRLCSLPAEIMSFIQSVPAIDSWVGSQTGC